MAPWRMQRTDWYNRSMDYRYPAGKSGTVIVPGWANLPIETAAALAGVKPAIHVWIDAPDLPRLEALAEGFSWTLLPVKKSKGAAPNPRLEYILGPDKAAVLRAAKTWYHPYINPGEFLGYPLCCVEKFRDWSAWVRRVLHTGEFTDIIRHSHDATTKREGLPFVNNDLFYCYSRHWRPGDDEARRAILNLNPGLDMAAMNLITWHPCTYRCAETKKRGSSTYNWLAKHVPELAAKIKLCLARPVLVWDWSRFAVLRGQAEKTGAISYQAVQPPFSKLKLEDQKALAEGNSLRRNGKAIEVLKDGKPVARLSDGAMLLEFK